LGKGKTNQEGPLKKRWDVNFPTRVEVSNPQVSAKVWRKTDVWFIIASWLTAAGHLSGGDRKGKSCGHVTFKKQKNAIF